MSDSVSEAVPPVEKASIFEDFIDIFVAPAKVYARRANSSFWAPLLVVTVLVGILGFANAGVWETVAEIEFQKQSAETIASRPNVTQEQMNASRGFYDFANKFGGFLSMPLIIVIVGIVTWLVSKFFDARLAFGAALTIVAFAYAPQIISQISIAIQGLMVDTSALTGRFQLGLGPARFLDPMTSKTGLQFFLGRIEVFTIWTTVLIGIGISVIGKVPRSKGLTAAAVIWLVGALPAIIQIAAGK